MFVTMLVSSTGLSLGLACVQTNIHVHTRIQASPTASRHDHIQQSETGYQYVEVNKQMLVSSPKSYGPSFEQCQSENCKDRIS